MHPLDDAAQREVRGLSHQIGKEEKNSVVDLVIKKLNGKGVALTHNDQEFIEQVLSLDASKITVVPQGSLKNEIIHRIARVKEDTHLKLDSEKEEMLANALTQVLNKHILTDKLNEGRFASSKLRLDIKARGEFINRTIETIEKKFNLTEKQKAELTQKIEAIGRSPLSRKNEKEKEIHNKIMQLALIIEGKIKEPGNVTDTNEKPGNLAILQAAVQIAVIDYLKGNQYKSDEQSAVMSEEAIKQLVEKEIVSKLKSYGVVQPVFKEAKVAERLHDRYDPKNSEQIPEHILAFDTSKEHIMKPEAYLDVRMARKTLESMQFVTKFGKNVEIFIGPSQDMKKLYELEGYTLVREIPGRTSNRYFYFENPNDHTDAKVVVTGASNSSKLAHQLLQLKFAGIDLGKVQVRGNFNDFLKEQTEDLGTHLSAHKLPPKIAFIGNRSLIIKELAIRYFPEEMAKVKNEKADTIDAKAEELLSAGNFGLTTVEVGKAFKYSYIKVPQQDGEPVGIIGMRMPNGSTAYDATKLLLENGVENLIMVGAGGSLSEEAGLSSCQLLDNAQYRGEIVTIDENSKMEIDFKPFYAKSPQYAPHKGQRNITVDSPLEENHEWFHEAELAQVKSVDVESYHIIRAFTEAAEGNKDLHILPGIFTSDVVEIGGDQTLEEKIDTDNAWRQMSSFLGGCFSHLKIAETL